MAGGHGIALTLIDGSSRRCAPIGIEEDDVLRPSVAWAGKLRTPARISGRCSARAWGMTPERSSLIRMTPATTENLLDGAPQKQRSVKFLPSGPRTLR